VIVMSVVILLAVGSDYNLLLVSRFKEERDHGLRVGIIRAMSGSGSVVTSAGLVFAFTMASFAVGDLLSTAQCGIAIALGLLFDTLIIRSFMTPAIAALLGRWFWWPQAVRTPASRRRLDAVFAGTPSERDWLNGGCVDCLRVWQPLARLHSSIRVEHDGKRHRAGQRCQRFPWCRPSPTQIRHPACHHRDCLGKLDAR
jgi:MMPL family